MRSGRCETCCKRHVKCDKQRPICQRCSTSNYECTWEADEGIDARIRFENACASGAGRQRGPVKTSIQTHGQDHTTTSVLPSGTGRVVTGTYKAGNTTQLVFQPKRNVLELAMNKYEYRFFRHAPPSLQVIEGFLARYGADLLSEDRPALNIAISAAALAYFGQTEDSNLAVTASRTRYQSALTRTRDAISKTAAFDVSDELLLTVMLLSGYEDTTGGFTHDARPPLPNSFRHTYGAAALLKHRQAAPGDRSVRSVELDKLVMQRVIRTSINHGVRVPLFPFPSKENWSMGDHSLLDQTALDACMVELADLRCSLLEVCRVDPAFTVASDPQLRAILERACALDTRLADFARSVDTSSEYAPCQRTEVEPRKNLCRSTRLRTNDIVVRILRRSKPLNQTSKPNAVHSDGWDEQRALHSIESLANDILASVPAHLGFSDGHAHSVDETCRTAVVNDANRLIFPLHTILSAFATSKKAKKEAEEAVLLVSRVVGNRVLSIVHGRAR